MTLFVGIAGTHSTGKTSFVQDVLKRAVDFHAKLTHHFHRILTHPGS